MNDTALLRSLIEKENISRSYQQRAQEILRSNNYVPSAEQCMMLQRAADLESEMAGMTIGAEKDRHIQEMNRLDQDCNRIRKQIDKSQKSASDSTAKKADGAGAGASGKANPDASGKANPDASGKTQEEIEIDRAVRTWYKDAPKISFEDVSGMEDLKAKLHSCIADSRADRLREYLQIPKLNSYFFVGPPGCGKTFICEAFAHELMDKEFKFISILGSDIISKYAGTAEKSVTRLFDEAMNNAPCIVFIDEIDSLCKNRSLPNLPEYAANITTSFLTGYNKIHNADSEVIFLAATNYPNRVDAAMLDRAEIIRLPLPDKTARARALEREFSYKVESGEGEDRTVEYKPIVQLRKDLSFDLMAEKTWRFNYRDIERFASAVKKTLFHELMEFFGDEKLAIEALESGDYKFSLKKFEEILEKFKPSSKEEILRDLLAWEKKVQSLADIAETDVSNMYDCESILGAPVAASAAAADDASSEQPTLDSRPVYALEDEVTVNPMTGAAEISFAIGVRKANHPAAIVGGEEMLLNETENGYSFALIPDEEDAAVKVNVRDDEGFIGSFTVHVKSAIAENDDFDI